ncbi:MAG: hypothetical protein HY343_03875 [Lentisphaerae bacterium]|nr:hypothetical protein [Lentisphaerota bacterium]
MSILIMLWIVVAMIGIGLSLPPSLKAHSWKFYAVIGNGDGLPECLSCAWQDRPEKLVQIQRGL